MSDRPLISLTMIVKNEAANLGRVLESARGVADEFVVVDTGSTDNTVDIARAYGAKVSFFTWIDDFSAARNHALDQASGQWVLILDGDDVARESAPGALRAEIQALDERAHFLRVPVRSPRGDGAGATVFGSRRIFRNVPEIRWHHPVHEMLFHASLEGAPGIEVGCASLVIDHLGYADAEHRIREKKGDRNLRILKQAMARYPDNAHWHYYLALQHANAGHNATALKMVRRALRRFSGRVRPDFEGALRVLGMKVARKMGRSELAVKIGRPGVASYAYSELCFELGLAHCTLQDYPQAERFLRLAISLRGRLAEFQSEVGAGSWKAMIQLGTVAWATGQAELALERWRAAYDWAPDQALANLALGRGLLAAGSLVEAEALLRRAAELAPVLGDAQVGLAEVLFRLGQHQAAYERLEGLTRREPGVASYWIYLADLLRLLEEHAACADVLGRAVAHHPKEAGLYERLGLSLHQIGRVEAARDAFALAAALQPDSTLAQAGLLATQNALAAA